MARYPNGKIPASLLVNVGPYHWLTAATAERWRRLVADILKHEGVAMRITPGKNGYRDLNGQKFARTNACRAGRCNDAAIPGTSSHGGEYQGRDSMAIDVDNWAVLGRDKWYAYCRKHGFEPGFFDWEPWHIIDWNPWVMPSASGASSSEEDDMTPEQANQLQQLFNATFKGGPSMSEGGNSIEASLAKLWNAVKPINRDGKQVALRQEVADTKTIVAGLEAGIQALAVAKGADPDAILKAVQDGVENAMRKVTFSADVDG